MGCAGGGSSFLQDNVDDLLRIFWRGTQRFYAKLAKMSGGFSPTISVRNGTF
jgi:hypothetical protein